MVRTYKSKGPGKKWRDEDMDHAASSVLQGDLSLRAAAGIFNVPFSTLKDRVNGIKRRNTLGDQTTFRAVGHPTVFTANEEKDLAERLKYLAARGFDYTAEQTRRAAFTYAQKKHIDHPWNEQEHMAGKDWFTNFLKRNADTWRKPQGMNKDAVEGFFSLLRNIYAELNPISNNVHLIFNVGETGIPLNTPLKIVALKGAREDVKLSSVERDENVTVVACCSAAGVFIPPFFIFKGARFRDVYKCDLPMGSEVAMTDSGYINENVFLEWLHHFQKNRTQGRCLLVLDGHTSHFSLESLDFCTENEIEIISLPPHTTHVLQPLDRTVFNALKSFYHQEATYFTQNKPNSSISQFNFGTLFTQAWKKSATIDNALKGFKCTGIYPFNSSAIPEHKYLHHNYFLTLEDAPETSYGNVDFNDASSSQSSPSQPSQLGLNTEGSEEVRKTSPFSAIIPSPTKQNAKKAGKWSATKHLTSDENYEEVVAKRRLKIEKGSNRLTNGIKISVPTSDEEDICHVAVENEEENVSCGVCNLRYSSSKSELKGNWIKCKKCGTWCHSCLVIKQELEISDSV